jgi:hypothetical protein
MAIKIVKILTTGYIQPLNSFGPILCPVPLEEEVINQLKNQGYDIQEVSTPTTFINPELEIPEENTPEDDTTVVVHDLEDDENNDTTEEILNEEQETTITRENLESMTKKEMLALCNDSGLEIESGATKNEIMEALLDYFNIV